MDRARYRRFTQPTWGSAIGTAVGYGLIVLVMFLLLFVGPYLIFRIL